MESHEQERENTEVLVVPRLAQTCPQRRLYPMQSVTAVTGHMLWAYTYVVLYIPRRATVCVEGLLIKITIETIQ